VEEEPFHCGTDCPRNFGIRAESGNDALLVVSRCFPGRVLLVDDVVDHVFDRQIVIGLVHREFVNFNQQVCTRLIRAFDVLLVNKISDVGIDFC
jgi:hypothetical protein